MADFELHSEQARESEREIERKGIALGIDWSNEVQVRELVSGCEPDAEINTRNSDFLSLTGRRNHDV